MSGQAQMPQPPKEFIIQAEDVGRLLEICDLQVPTGPGTKIKQILMYKIKPYEAPTAPKK
ncbi:hypothetical protein KDU71_07395 [Carboxylicivirga sediminis]|uniref:Uncharacterized protein n=1 Tax=Carboxylicivirga sediminis TaxID=2006564 RepID=A0A941IWN9_9BACT|nr:hypothetical protein [Carboxylicivirga sediminis]MBR8535380.1 hypothetical protein [Carboxylicivirga sediminis]